MHLSRLLPLSGAIAFGRGCRMKPAPRNGVLRHRVTINQVIRTADGAGGFARDDQPAATVAAQVETLGANEIRAYSNLQERVSHRALIRYRAGVDQGQGAIWHHPKGDIALYVISAVDCRPERPGEWMELLCRQGGNT